MISGPISLNSVPPFSRRCFCSVLVSDDQVFHSCFDGDLPRCVGLLKRLLIHLHQRADVGHDRIVFLSRWALETGWPSRGANPSSSGLLSGEHQPTLLAYPATDVAHTASHATRHCTATFQSCQNCLPFQDHTILQHHSVKSPCLVAPEILNLKLIHCRFTFFLFSRKFSYSQWFRGLSFCRVYLFRF